MKLSKKLALLFIGALVFFSLLLLLFTNVFLEKYYIYKKKNDIQLVKAELTAYIKENSTATLDQIFRDFLSTTKKENIFISLFDEDGYPVNSFSEYKSMKDILIIVDGEPLKDIGDYKYYITSKGTMTDISRGQIGILYKIEDSDSNLICYCYLYAPKENVKENVKVFNMFILYGLVIVLLLTIVLVSVLSNSITKNIKTIEKITKKISNLDFNTPIPVKSADELGSLSVSINKMSKQLKKSIDSLKEANLKLEKDLELETKINDLRKEFISDVSHDLKTPISIIGGYAEALESGILSKKERQEYLDVIKDESEKMNLLVQDLLKYSQIESGLVNLNLETFYINDLIEDSIKQFRINPKEVNLEVDIEKSLVLADYSMIKSVISNYLSNALHYASDPKYIKISSSINGEFLRVEVFDRGSFISEEESTRIWDSFYKADKSRSREYGGSGLGLSIVKSIMEKYGCAYGCANKEDGVVFFFDVRLSNE